MTTSSFAHPGVRDGCSSRHETSAFVDHPVSAWQRVLLATDGTVTHLLELYSGEPIMVRKLEDVDVDGSLYPAAGLLRASSRIRLRRVLLTGALSGKNHLYAESFIALDWLGGGIRDRLLGSERPIGRILADARTETFREILDMSCEPIDPLTAYFPGPSPACLLTRRYAIFEGGRPVMLIQEKFPCTHFLSVEAGASTRG